MTLLTARVDADLDALQRESFSYFEHEVNPTNGLVNDKTAPGWPASIAATGFALAAYPIGVERGFISRAAAVERTLATLRFFLASPHGPEPNATGYMGFYYHFLETETGRRAWSCELSTVDSAFLLAGMLTAAAYFDARNADEQAIRTIADTLYRRTNWRWAQNGRATLTHGWKPESGFLPYRWEGYDEGLLLYMLALGSPTFPLAQEAADAWRSTYQWKSQYGYDYLYAGSLFAHQLSHMWIDFRGIQDSFMCEKGIDYFENSRRATHVQQRYAIDNPGKFNCYGRNCWGITASDGPGPALVKIDGVERRFFDYVARGVPYGPDDGTIAPWAVAASLPFAPDIVLPAISYFVNELQLKTSNSYGFKATFNATYPVEAANRYGWVSRWHFGINQGPVVLMIENYRSELLWQLTRKSPYIVSGLRSAGFAGGWLQNPVSGYERSKIAGGSDDSRPST
jgi:hypothetical protein